MLFIYQLSSAGEDGLVVDPRWIIAGKKAGHICRRCDGVIRERVAEIQHVLVSPTDPPRVHYGSVSGEYSGTFISDKLLEMIGRERLRRRHRLLAIQDFKGHKYPYTYVIEKKELGCARGEKGSQSELCPLCGRLLYWADQWYVLRRYWPSGTVFQVLNGAAFVDGTFYERTIRPRRLSRLKGIKIPLSDEAKDGLPTEFRAMKEAIREGRGCRPSISVW